MKEKTPAEYYWQFKLVECATDAKGPLRKFLKRLAAKLNERGYVIYHNGKKYNGFPGELLIASPDAGDQAKNAFHQESSLLRGPYISGALFYEVPAGWKKARKG